MFGLVLCVGYVVFGMECVACSVLYVMLSVYILVLVCVVLSVKRSVEVM